MNDDHLKELRDRIDALDDEILRLLNDRAEIALEIGELKQNGAIYRPEREAQVLRRLQELNRGPMPAAAVARLFTEVMSACRALEDSFSVAFLGPRGTFSEEAAIKHFGGSTGKVAAGSIDEVFRKVEAGLLGLWGGPGRELHRGRGRTNARSPAGDAAPDLRRDHAARAPVSARAAQCCRGAHLFPRAEPGPVPQLARTEFPRRRARSRGEQRRSGAPRVPRGRDRSHRKPQPRRSCTDSTCSRRTSRTIPTTRRVSW